MKLKELYDLLDSTSKIELRSCYGDKKLLYVCDTKRNLDPKYADTDVVEISQSGDLFIVLFLDSSERGLA